ncbi:MAG: exodeoxyribonuclease VII large subunit [Gammaproteobacteria bacterium]|nr:exodeoxyribonuclease VII large subunit [Gammaproteobacteria bacterium]
MQLNFDDRPILTVSALAREARLLIEQRFNLVWVEGELSNFRQPGSGHWYFTLKDSGAQLRCAMFASRNRAVRFPLQDGSQVIVRGRVSLYEARGDFQLIADHIELAGEGALRAAIEALKVQLAAEGLFATERKKPLPEFPRHLAVISSKSGAALRDVLSVVQRRFPALAVTLIPVAVQGENSETEVLQALDRVETLGVDVVLLTRGGGSLEDLWTFNLESVARAIARCPVPVVSAIGHETDITVADFVADVRAPTPSAGAELITPDRREISSQFDERFSRLLRSLNNNIRYHQQTLQGLRAPLLDMLHPRRRLQQHMQRADDLDERLRLGLTNKLIYAKQHLQSLHRNMLILRPQTVIQGHKLTITRLKNTLNSLVHSILDRQQVMLATISRTLQAVSPLSTLSRGYAVLSDGEGKLGAAISSIEQVADNDRITAHLQDGSLTLQVEKIDTDNQLPNVTIVAVEDE